MKTYKIAATILAVVALTGCGGSEGQVDPPPPPPPVCAPAGTWHLVSVPTSTTGGANCTAALNQALQSTAALGVAGSTYTWNEGDLGNGSGVIDLAACALSVTEASSSQVGTDANGNPIFLTISTTRALTFDGASATGTSTVAVVPSANAPPIAGYPCSVSYTTAGTRL